MSAQRSVIGAERLDLLQWVASLGAITAEALSARNGISLASARGRLSAACRQGLLSRAQMLSGRPALFTLTAAGRRAVGLGDGAVCRVSPSNATHLIACAQAAASLERCYPGYRALGERELRGAERACGHPLASARLMGVHGGASGLHRPDLVLVLVGADGERTLPIAVEVELTTKAPRRLRAICRAWTRCPHVAGVLYLVGERVEPAVVRAVAAAGARERVAIVRLDALAARPA
jgi:hypothetical protein